MDIEKFITRWQHSSGAERANYQLFLTDLCDVLGVDRPEPQRGDVDHDYVFEKPVRQLHADTTETVGFIDLYRRGSFVLEAKQGSEASTDRATVLAEREKRRARRGTAKRGTRAWDDAMVNARAQAERYAKSLPEAEGWPPFIVVVDVGYTIELFSDFARSGKRYIPFPDPRSYRIRLDELRDETVRARLRAVWADPMSLDPSRYAAAVTREVAVPIAALARSLEAAGHAPRAVADFLMRCLFTMFAEDIELLPLNAFNTLLHEMRAHPDHFDPMLEALWTDMDEGRFSVALRSKLLRFNGYLFKDRTVLPLSREQIGLLAEAAKRDWRAVEPAIFGTLIERALDPKERHKLGAHYTPRAYVERLVFPTVIDPLREQWEKVRAEAVTKAAEDDEKGALEALKVFHRQLCATRVLDPACGTGNFLYVTMEHM